MVGGRLRYAIYFENNYFHDICWVGTKMYTQIHFKFMSKFHQRLGGVGHNTVLLW
jgi:hypothetical protein